MLLRDYVATDMIEFFVANDGGFAPTDVSAVAAWLRIPEGTITGSGYSSVPDKLASNPATQGTDADRPPSATSANGFSIMDLDGTSDFLSWPAASNNNQTVTCGYAGWLKPDIVSSAQGILCAIPGATNRIELLRSSADLSVDIYISQFSSRRGAIASVFAAGTWVFVTWEYDGGGANDAARCTITINGVVQTLTFSDSSGAPGAMPATLVNTAGPFLIGCRIAASHTGCWDGKFGPNQFVLGSKMTGATQGLLTASARTALMNFEAPT